MENTNTDQTKTWVFGKVATGWYCARTTWDKAWADHLESQGYRVERSVKKPEVA